MSGKPEHRSLDEVKRLLRSLEETPADETLAPPPKAAVPANRELDAKPLSVVAAPTSPPPMPAAAAAINQASAKQEVVPLAPLKARTRPESVLSPTPPSPEKSSAGRMIAGIALAVGAVAIAGIAIWQNGGGSDRDRASPTAATVTTASPQGKSASARDVEQAPSQGVTKASVDTATASAPSPNLNATSVVSPTPDPGPAAPQPDTAVPSAKDNPSPATPAAIKSDVVKIAAPESTPTEPVRLAQAVTAPERGTTAALPPPVPPAVPPRVEENRPILQVPRQAPPLAQSPTAVEPARPPAASSAPMNPPPGMADTSRLEEAEIAKLIQDGRAQLDNGNVATARLLFRRAAESGSGEAARLLGDTYDPAKLYAMGVRGTSGDMERAIHWYERADELGDPLAKARLAPLGTR